MLALYAGDGLAETYPAVGVFEMVPARGENAEVEARPTYIMTDARLSGPTVFSGLQLVDKTIEVVCCFEVKQATPLSLPEEIDKQPNDLHFGAVLKGIKGYRYIYRAQPVARQRWNRAMQSLMRELRGASDGYPFSLGVIAATFDKPSIPQTFEAGGYKTRYSYRYSDDEERLIHTFVQDKRKVEFSEDTYLGASH